MLLCRDAREFDLGGGRNGGPQVGMILFKVRAGGPDANVPAHELAIVRFPVLGEQQIVTMTQVAVLDSETLPLENEVCISVVPHRSAAHPSEFPFIISYKRAFTWPVAGLLMDHYRHSTVANAAAISLDAALPAARAVDGQAMLVAPKPEHGLVDKLAQLDSGF